MAHGAVAIEAPAGVVVTQINWAWVLPGLVHPSGDLGIGQPMLDQILECWEIDAAAGFSRCGDERLSWAGVSSSRSFAFP